MTFQTLFNIELTFTLLVLLTATVLMVVLMQDNDSPSSGR